MAVTCTGEGRVLRAAISGEVDHHRARAIMEELSRQIDLELPRSLTLDLEGVTFMDSSGIAVLLRAARSRWSMSPPRRARCSGRQGWTSSWNLNDGRFT
jgi:anti-anti-sigma factor